MHVCMPLVCMHHMHVSINKPEEGIRSSETGVRSGCEPTDEGAGNRTWFLCKRTSAVNSEPSLEVHEFLSFLNTPCLF